MPRPRENLLHQKFGELVVIRASEKPLFWTCHCSCGQIVDVRANALKAGNTKSCGHLRKLNGNHFKGTAYQKHSKMVSRVICETTLFKDPQFVQALTYIRNKIKAEANISVCKGFIKNPLNAIIKPRQLTEPDSYLQSLGYALLYGATTNPQRAHAFKEFHESTPIATLSKIRELMRDSARKSGLPVPSVEQIKKESGHYDDPLDAVRKALQASRNNSPQQPTPTPSTPSTPPTPEPTPRELDAWSRVLDMTPDDDNDDA